MWARIISMLLMACAMECMAEQTPQNECTKYDFETRMLEKWMEMRYHVDSVQRGAKEEDAKMKATVEAALGEVANLRKDMDAMKEDLEHEQETQEKKDANVPAPISQCENGWVVFQGSCYLFVKQLKSFNSAEVYCQEHSSHLVHIGSTAENSFLQGYVSDLKDANHWIGMTDEAKEGTWIWVDDKSSLSFTDWHPKQPNQGRTSNCGALWVNYGYRWVDEPCYLRYRFICEKRPE